MKTPWVMLDPEKSNAKSSFSGLKCRSKHRIRRDYPKKAIYFSCFSCIMNVLFFCRKFSLRFALELYPWLLGLEFVTKDLVDIEFDVRREI